MCKNIGTSIMPCSERKIKSLSLMINRASHFPDAFSTYNNTLSMSGYPLLKCSIYHLLLLAQNTIEIKNQLHGLSLGKNPKFPLSKDIKQKFKNLNSKQIGLKNCWCSEKCSYVVIAKYTISKIRLLPILRKRV